MDAARRAQGGANNQKGNRYEDLFAVFKLAEYAPRVLEQHQEVRFKPQASCPVDDLLIEASDESHFHQMKARKFVSWGQEDGKLKGEFLAQRTLCSERPQRPFKLWLVVSEASRADALKKSMPPELADCAEVLHFPECARPSELVDVHPPAAERLRAAFGGDDPSTDDLKTLARHLCGCWMDAPLDDEGFKRAGPLLRGAVGAKSPPLRHRWTPPDDRWSRAEALLRAVHGFECRVDTGYFCWRFRGTDSGTLPYPCGSPQFSRFLDDLLRTPPIDFSDLERRLV